MPAPAQPVRVSRYLPCFRNNCESFADLWNVARYLLARKAPIRFTNFVLPQNCRMMASSAFWNLGSDMIFRIRSRSSSVKSISVRRLEPSWGRPIRSLVASIIARIFGSFICCSHSFAKSFILQTLSSHPKYHLSADRNTIFPSTILIQIRNVNPGRNRSTAQQ